MKKLKLLMSASVLAVAVNVAGIFSGTARAVIIINAV